jgi:histidine ammonia-lyase
MHADLCERIALVEEDRALDGELRALVTNIRQESWALYVD